MKKMVMFAFALYVIPIVTMGKNSAPSESSPQLTIQAARERYQAARDLLFRESIIYSRYDDSEETQEGYFQRHKTMLSAAKQEAFIGCGIYAASAVTKLATGLFTYFNRDFCRHHPGCCACCCLCQLSILIIDFAIADKVKHDCRVYGNELRISEQIPAVEQLRPPQMKIGKDKDE